MADDDTPPLMMQSASETPDQLASGLNIMGSPLMAGVKPGSKAAQRMMTSLPPSAAGAKARQVPTLQLGTPAAGAPGLMDRINAREAEADKLSGDISDRYGALQKQYEAASQNSSALKDLLQSTTQQIQQAQMGPSKWDLLARASAAMSKPTGLGGMAAAFGNAANAGADVHDQQRAAELQRLQMQYQMGLQGNQAQQQGIQYGIQGSMAGLQGMQTRLNAANAGADRLTTAYGQQQNAAAANAAKYDPSLQGDLAYIKALMTLKGNMNGVEGTGAGGSNPQVDAIASYEAPMPTPSARMTPVQQAQYKGLFAAVKQANPDWRQDNYDLAKSVRKDFDLGPNSGNKVSFINNVQGHLQTYDQLMQALKASGGQTDSPVVNKLLQTFATQTGHPEVTSLEALQGFLADELVKSVVPNAGTGKEREHETQKMAATIAPDQWEANKKVYADVLHTQLSDLQQKFYGSLNFMPKPFLDKEWNAKIAPQSRALLTPEKTFATAAEAQAARDKNEIQDGDAIVVAGKHGKWHD